LSFIGAVRLQRRLALGSGTIETYRRRRYAHLIEIGDFSDKSALKLGVFDSTWRIFLVNETLPEQPDELVEALFSLGIFAFPAT